MKNLKLHLAALAMLYPVQGWAASAGDFFPICAKPAQPGRTLTVNPGSQGIDTYPTVAAALAAAKPGDAIALVTGDYGDLAITGMNQNGFITIEAAPGQTPRFTKLSIGGHGGASHWRLTGLTISGFSTGRGGNGAIAHNSLVFIGNSDNIILEHNNIFSQSGDFSWQSEITVPDTPAVSDAIGADQSSCISVVDNKILNVFNGMIIGGDQSGDHGKYFLVSGNAIDNFAGDGIDHSVSHARILHNRITNGHDICDNKCVHTDGIQGWNWHNKPGLVNTDIVIDSNVIIAQTKPSIVLPADDLHGITIFDGRWDEVQVTNNLIVTDTWHGITIARARNLSVINNTVAGTNSSRNTWIKFAADKNDPPDMNYNVVIRNNITVGMTTDRRDLAFPGVSVDHNLTMRDVRSLADLFVKFSPSDFSYDMHLSRKSDAKGEGSAEGAPPVDIEGTPRGTKVDVGAYAFRPS